MKKQEIKQPEKVVDAPQEEDAAIAATELVDYSRILQSIWFHERFWPILGFGLWL